MSKATQVVVIKSLSDPDKLAAYSELARPAVEAAVPPRPRAHALQDRAERPAGQALGDRRCTSIRLRSSPPLPLAPLLSVDHPLNAGFTPQAALRRARRRPDDALRADRARGAARRERHRHGYSRSWRHVRGELEQHRDDRPS